MAFNHNRIGRLRADDYDQFEAEIKRAFIKHHGTILHVAMEFSVSPKTIHRWLNSDHELREFVDKLKRVA